MLELEHIQKSFDGVPVLKDISLQVADGEIVSILGPSGCGKTTLLNLILGIVDADSDLLRRAEPAPYPHGEAGLQHCLSGLCSVSQSERPPEHHLRSAQQAGDLYQRRGGGAHRPAGPAGAFEQAH